MGCDITLKSVLTNDVCEGIANRTFSAGVDDPVGNINRCYEAMMESGGYFRDADNRGSLIRALGMDWLRDVVPMLTEDHHLRIPAARFLLAEIESRHVTPEYADRVVTGHVVGPLEHILGTCEDRWDIAPEHLMQHWDKRRKILIALLKRSIDLAEPLSVAC
jgi:hypothetical protein